MIDCYSCGQPVRGSMKRHNGAAVICRNRFFLDDVNPGWGRKLSELRIKDGAGGAAQAQCAGKETAERRYRAHSVVTGERGKGTAGDWRRLRAKLPRGDETYSNLTFW